MGIDALAELQDRRYAPDRWLVTKDIWKERYRASHIPRAIE